MATFQRDYADPNQNNHEQIAEGSITGASAVTRFAVFTAMNLYSLQATVVTAGTSVGAGAGIVVTVTSGTAVSTIGTLALGSSTAGATFNLAASTSPGGHALVAGDVVTLTQGTDATVVAAYAVEGGFNFNSTFTL